MMRVPSLKWLLYKHFAPWWGEPSASAAFLAAAVAVVDSMRRAARRVEESFIVQ